MKNQVVQEGVNCGIYHSLLLELCTVAAKDKYIFKQMSDLRTLYMFNNKGVPLTLAQVRVLVKDLLKSPKIKWCRCYEDTQMNGDKVGLGVGFRLTYNKCGNLAVNFELRVDGRSRILLY